MKFFPLIVLAMLTSAEPAFAQDKGQQAAPAAPAPARAATGSISGIVSYEGSVPLRKPVDTSGDPVCAKTKLQSEELIVTSGKLEGVHVRIKAGTAGKHRAPSAPLVIVQEGCSYRPHVIGAMVGQALAIRNKDTTMHNVHAYVEGETWFNRSQPKGAPDIVETDTGAAGEVFELKCNVHAWMHSFVPISDHPFFDVSGNDGSFTIKNVPSGSYVLEAWHPKLGLKSMKIAVKDAATSANFQYP